MKKDNPGRDLALLILGMVLTVAGLYLFFHRYQYPHHFSVEEWIFGELWEAVFLRE